MSDADNKVGDQRWNEQVAELIAVVGSPDFWRSMTEMLMALVDVDDLVVLLFVQGKPPALAYGYLPRAEQVLLEKNYIHGAYVLDPCYQQALRNEWGFYWFNGIIPDGFYDSELYRIYYEKSSILDEVGYLIEGEQGSFINISATRFHDSPEFTEDEKAKLAQIEPVIAAAVKEYLRQNVNPEEQEKLPLHKMMAEVLDLFGTSVLTSRETDVVHLILKGYSAQSIANYLDISINTVKLHRKNAYAKLDISSQSELFHLFIDSLSCIDDNFSRDPLVAYLQVPGAEGG